jgi:DNA repair exonuclease SbcCD nuclease subunit
MRFIHTADWQIGKSFRRFGEREPLLRQARLDAIERIGAAAIANGAAHVLVAGDVFDHFAPLDRTIMETVERMKRFPSITWRLLPGNHDPHRPDAVWDRLLRAGPPANVRVMLEPEAQEIEPGVVLLPAPLKRTSESADLTRWMNDASSEPGAIRIGLAHGAITGFSAQQEAGNPIDPARPASAGLAYLALGDWHRTMQINARVWYAGTPEPDRVGSQSVGQALLVELDGADAQPRVTSLETGAYRWETRAFVLSDETDVHDLEARARALPDTLRTLLRLDVSGALPLAARARLAQRLENIAAAVFHLDVDLDDLAVRPSAEDLEAIDFDGVLRTSAERLRARAADAALSAVERRVAEDALVQLFLLPRGGEPA